MENLEREENTIDIRKMLFTVFRHKWIICLISIVCALAMFLFCNITRKPQYTATTEVFILKNNNNNNISYSDLQTSNQLTGDYEQLIKNIIVTEEVIDRMNLNTTPAALSSKITVTAKENTRIIAISVSDSDPYLARDIANMVRKVSSEKIVEVMNIDAVNLISEARIPTSKTGTGAVKKSIIAFIVAFAVCAAAVVFFDMMNETIRTPDDITKILELTTLGTVPDEQIRLNIRKGANG